MCHKSGGVYQLRPLPLPVAGNNAQAVGSAISYARPYQLSAVLNLAPDDDGNAARNGADNTRPAQAVRPFSTQRAQNGTTAHQRNVDPKTGEITSPAPASDPANDVDFGMDNGKATESIPYYRHAWNQLTGKPYDLVKGTALLHSKSDKACTVKQYGYLVSLVDASRMVSMAISYQSCAKPRSTKPTALDGRLPIHSLKSYLYCRFASAHMSANSVAAKPILPHKIHLFHYQHDPPRSCESVPQNHRTLSL